MKELNIRTLSLNILDRVCSLLDAKGIVIPCSDPMEEEDREQNNGSSLYGTEYSELEDEITKLLYDTLNSIKGERVAVETFKLSDSIVRDNFKAANEGDEDKYVCHKTYLFMKEREEDI